ncbi:MAG: 50S ribosomal protein L29 [Mycoplasma sp.]|nr:50S ribosomal protein L29 [Mycoplasma sp.]
MLMKDLSSKSTTQIKKLIDDLKAQLFQLRFKNATGQLEQTHKIEAVKKDIARCFSALNSKISIDNSKIKNIIKQKPLKNSQTKPIDKKSIVERDK